MTVALAPLFAPRGVVVVGASRAPGKLGTAMTEALQAGPVPVALVNRSGGEGMSVSIAEAVDALAGRGSVADLVVSCVPASATAEVVRDAGRARMTAALVCAGGFAEVGEAGAQNEAALRSAALDSGVRVLGPNTSGFFVPAAGLRASFVPGVANLRPGGVAVVASSGGVNHMLAFRLSRSGVGVSLGVGIGAGMGVGHANVLDYLATDDATTAVALHLETVPDGPRLLAAVRQLSRIKPVVALVVGRRTESAFAQSHTGSLATSWRTTRAVLAQAGAVIVDDEEQLVAAVAALSLVRLPPLSQPGVALVTAQAGPGLLIDDHAAAGGWRLPSLAPDTRDTLATLLPPLTFQANPVDTGRPGEGFPSIVRAVGDDPAIDLVAVYALTEPVVDLPRAVAASGCQVPVLLAMDGAADELDASMRVAAELRLPMLSGPSALSWAVRAVVEDSRRRANAEETADPPRALPVDCSGPWDEVRAKDLLDAHGIVTPQRRVVTDLDAAVAAMAQLGAPVAVKLVDSAVLHKTDIGGVYLGVSDAEQMGLALAGLASIGASRYLVEKMASSGVDLVASVRRDPVFGPIAVLAFGGTAAEAVDDVSIGSVPAGRAVVDGMVDGLRTAATLFGWRGGPTLDRAALARIMGELGTLLTANPDLQEIEINPLRLTGDGLVALDAVVITVKEDVDD
jgi:acetyltransferase